jgi:DNA helicase-2/ATP-dependent DNA helicase PcrA
MLCYTFAMPTTPVFDKLYKSLNTEQKKAVDAIEGPVMVIAGPGTGKTQILALRIANILKETDTAPENILALAFTESAVHAMRKRLIDIIGAPAYKINIYTFHGFANDTIQNYPESFPEIIGARPATDIDQIEIIEMAIEETKLKLLKPYGDPFYYVRPALSAIKNLKRENVHIDDFRNLNEKQEQEFKAIPDLYYESGAHAGKMKGKYADIQKKIEKNKELAVLYAAYEAELRNRKLYDFEDMLIKLIEALEADNDLLLQLQEKYQYILADEHQDANNAQNRILELLTNFHDNPNLFIVGDEKQAIFRFQGASLENFLYFKKLHPGASVISLTENYRSIQNILDSAHSVIEHNPVHDESLRKELKAHKKDKTENKIKVLEFSKEDFEHIFLAHDIQIKINTGTDPREIAIIYRENRDALPIARVLEKQGIPFIVQSDQDVLADNDIENLILLMRAIDGIGNDALLAQALYINFLGIVPLDAFKITQYANKHKIKLTDVLGSGEYLEEAGVAHKDIILNFHNKLNHWSGIGKNKNILDVFEMVITESGFLNHVLSDSNPSEKVAKLDTLFNEIRKIGENKKTARIHDLITFIDTVSDYRILIKTNTIGPEREGVRLMTAHKSKGLEFGYVYIVGAYDTHWGSKRDRTLFSLNFNALATDTESQDDERRLFYVALTRAKSGIVITFSKTGADGRERLPAQFIAEIKPAFLEYIDTKKIEHALLDNPTAKYEPAKTRMPGMKDREYLAKLFLEQGLSVTALNKYLQCPWDYFFNNLLRLPTAKTKHQMYGTAVHDALKDFFSAYGRGEDPSKEFLIKRFEWHADRQPFAEADFEESRAKGIKALSGYYDAFSGMWPKSLFVEFAVSGLDIEVTLDGKKHKLPIRGVLDKIELGEGNKVKVVDYKTAMPKSRNAILGKTKDTEAPDYYRQLLFYKLLLQKFEQGKYRMVSGAIDFIEPDDKGRYHKEEFEMSDTEIKEFEALIQKVSEEIYSLKFWEEECKEDDCDFCHLRKMIVEQIPMAQSGDKTTA